jgi:hypothetical protein
LVARVITVDRATSDLVHVALHNPVLEGVERDDSEDAASGKLAEGERKGVG